LKQTFGCRVTECTDGVQALHHSARGRQLPRARDGAGDLSGIEVLEMIRAAATARHLRVIVMSRERPRVTSCCARCSSAWRIRAEPVRSETLSTKIARLVRNPAAQTVSSGRQPHARVADPGTRRRSSWTPI